MDVLGSVTEKTSSELILFFVVMVVAVVIAGRPLYDSITKAREKKRDQYMEQVKQQQEQQDKREERFMKVIQDNSTVISELSTIMKNNQLSCADCKQEQTSLYKELNEKQDNMNTSLEIIKNNLLKEI